MTEIEKLIRKRGSVKAKLTLFTKFINELKDVYPDRKIDDDNLIPELESRFERFQSILTEFEECQTEIDQLISGDEAELAQFTERENFEKAFHTINAEARRFCNANVEHDNESIASSRSGNQTQLNPDVNLSNFGGNIKLPVIQLPKFDGKYDEWLEFRDSFDSLIHKNNSIGEIQKFHYLRASLTHGASEIIASLEFSSANYSVAWDLICKQYNNTRILIQNHVTALYNLEKVTEESSQSIRKMTDNVTKHLRALKIFDEPTESWDTLIIHLIAAKLDSLTVREWEQKKSDFEKPKLSDLQDFLKNRADLLESLQQNKSSKETFKSKQDFKTRSFVGYQASCSFCKKEHYSQDCPDFQRLSVNERLNEVKKIKLCINCLRSGHMVKQCHSSSCKHCKGRHHSLLHIAGQIKSSSPPAPAKNADKNETINCSSRNTCSDFQVLLSTISLNVFDKDNNTHIVRALLDAGSQSNFISLNLVHKLKSNLSNINIKICGLNQTESQVKYKTKVRIRSRYNGFNENINCLVVPEITGTLPNFKIDPDSLEIPTNINLADPNFHLPGKIDMLIGAEHFWHIMCVGQQKLKNHRAILQKSKFGWIISGALGANQARVTQCNFSRDLGLEEQLARFWEIEELPHSSKLSAEEKQCEAHFIKTVQRENDGRFVVTIPLKQNPEVLGESFETARGRFLSLEKRFNGNLNFKQEYCNFISEYIALGHMNKIEFNNTKPHYYLPHHGVVKENSTTTKLRVVFDGSCATSTGHSLNDIQVVGPTIQPDLFATLIRYRKYNYVIGSDIEKMYRMCLVAPNQRSLQRILWREDPQDQLEAYELATVTYGTSSAAYLAIRCLHQLGTQHSTSKLISNVITNHFYVDDLLSGADTIDEAIFVANEVAKVLQTGGFKLRKWTSNSQKVLQGIRSHDTVESLNLGSNENTKTLGLIWIAQRDILTYNINKSFNQHITKRSILSETSQIFDPLGLLSPTIILSKILLQEIWSEKLGWDESLPSHIHTRWLQFRNELNFLNDLEIKRQVTCKLYVKAEIHGFSDASTRAYGACIYMKSFALDGTTQISLICAKSKVAPLKTQTIPRLELMAALLLAELITKVKSSLDMPIEHATYWCDSTIVLGWLKTPPNLLQTFVAHRVATLQELTDIHAWRHVPTSENPADCVSRGVMPKELKNLKLYWYGPEWLKGEQDIWPTLQRCDTELPEMKKTIHAFKTVVKTYNFSFERHSNLTRLERIIAYCIRFRQNCSKHKSARNFGPLLANEIANASLLLVKISQEDCFSNEIKQLQEKQRVSPKSRLFKLNPFLDDSTVLRVGGRLRNSSLTYEKKHPILLASSHAFTKLHFVRKHQRLLHAGPQHLLACIRDKYWPLLGRNLARKTVHNCVRCFRVKPRGIAPIMGNLPNKRITPAPPFYNTGVDYAGPFQALHLELVSDLTKDSFLAAFRRFIARRGKPFQMYSDNGTNFIGAHSELRALGEFLNSNATVLTESMENEGISWSFIPAHSPHFGGLWEAGVKAVKYHLRRVMTDVVLTFEQFATLLAQVESVLNSRPMSPMSSDPTDFTPLTPSHFLIGRPSTAAPDPDIRQLPTNRLDQFQRIQQLQQHFWARWSREYLSELQHRQKWPTQEGILNLNDLVVIKDDNQPPLKWSLGRIINLHPGSDGIARVATIKTSTGIIKRSFAKICPLPSNISECVVTKPSA